MGVSQETQSSKIIIIIIKQKQKNKETKNPGQYILFVEWELVRLKDSFLCWKSPGWNQTP